MPRPLEINDPEELEARGAPASGTIAAFHQPRPGAPHRCRSRALDSPTTSAPSASRCSTVGREGPQHRRQGDVRCSAWVNASVARARRAAGRPSRHCSTGLYHFALLVPAARRPGPVAGARRPRTRRARRSLRSLRKRGHLPERSRRARNRDLPRPTRTHWEGQVAARMTTLPLDVEYLLAELRTTAKRRLFRGLPGGTIMGHVHLKVAASAAGHRVLPRRPGLRADGRARGSRRVSQRRRLSPPHRCQHLGKRRRLRAAGRCRGSAPRDDRVARRGRARTRACTMLSPRLLVARRRRRTACARSLGERAPLERGRHQRHACRSVFASQKPPRGLD